MISFKPSFVVRYAAIARLLVKYGHTETAEKIGLGSILTNNQAAGNSSTATPQSLASDLEQLGPTFIKLGQLLSTRSDFLPEAYLTALSRLQDDTKPIPYAVVEKIVEEGLGVRISKAFATFETTPLAAASIGQVHRATMRDGRQVVVKVQRPDLMNQVRDDLGALHELATVVDSFTETGRRARFVQIVESLRDAMLDELDYRKEAENCRTLKKNLSRFERFYVPEVIDDYSSEKVLTSEYVEGAKITELSPVVLIELDRKALADQLFHVYLHQVMIDGIFHADPHPGNLMLTADKRLVLMDFGMVCRVAPELRRRLIKLLLALGDGRAEQTAEEAIAMGTPYKMGDFREAEFRSRVTHLVSQNQGRPWAQLQVGRLMVELNAIAGETGLKFPNSLTMLGKTLLNLDKVVSVLDEEFDSNAALKRHAGELFGKHNSDRLSLGRLYDTLLESAEFIERFPERMNKIADLVANNRIQVRVDAVDERKLITGLQKIANRITAGLILAAMIIGASLMMHLKTSLTFFGYPVIAMIFFTGAAVAASMLLFQTAFSDVRDHDD